MFILPNYYDDWNKQWQEMSERLKSFSSQLNGLDLNDYFRDMKDTLARLNSISYDKQFKIYDTLHKADFSQLLGVSEQIKALSSVNISGMSTALKQFVDNDYFKEFKNLSIDMPEIYDFQKLANIMQDSFCQIDWSQDVSVDEITEEVVEQYIKEEFAEQVDNNDSNVQNVQLDKKQIRKDIEGTISFWVGIVSLLLTIYGLVNSKPTVVCNTYNNTTEVNCNYTIDIGIDAELMNNLGYRIINQNNVMPRVKPDCSSTVTGHLYIGQVVIVSDKYKKWIEISWKDDEENYCFGWIQNYKVTEFK